MERGRLPGLSDALNAEDSGVRAFVMLSEGRPIFEHYRKGIEPSDLQSINSVTKSVVSMLVGVALREGALRDVRQRLGAFLPETHASNVDERVRDITLEHLLTMTSGFAWDERVVDACLLGPCADFENDHARLRFTLSRSLAHEPGTHFEYDSHAAHLLSVILARATGCSIDEYAKKKLFLPLNIARFEWLVDEDGYPFASHGVKLATKDMASIGLVMAQKGAYSNTQLIEQVFVKESTRAHSAGGFPMDETGYGYLWWIAPRAFMAAGFGEQFLIVEPERQLVVAVNSDSGKAQKKVLELCERYV